MIRISPSFLGGHLPTSAFHPLIGMHLASALLGQVCLESFEGPTDAWLLEDLLIQALEVCEDMAEIYQGNVDECCLFSQSITVDPRKILAT